MNCKLMLVAFCILSCSCGPDRKVDQWEKDSNTKPLDKASLRYKNAVHSAQSTIDSFLTLLKDHQHNGLQFFIKSPFVEGDVIEHMWVETDTAYGGVAYGRLGNDPVNLTKMKYTDKVKVPIKDVEDYMVYDGDSILLGDFLSRSLPGKAD